MSNEPNIGKRPFFDQKLSVEHVEQEALFQTTNKQEDTVKTPSRNNDSRQKILTIAPLRTDVSLSF